MQFFKIFFILFWLITFHTAVDADQKSELIGVIVPTEYEANYILKQIQVSKKTNIDGINYTIGKIQNKDVVFAFSGLGEANSAITTTRFIHDFHPNLLILSGSSGNISNRAKIGDILIGQEVIDVDLGKLTNEGVKFDYQDYLYHPHKKEKLPLSFILKPHLTTFLNNFIQKNTSPKILMGTIATSDALPNPDTQISFLQNMHVDVVEMEGATFMQACWVFNSNCVVVRGVSNNANEPITLDGVKEAADSAGKVTESIIATYPSSN